VTPAQPKRRELSAMLRAARTTGASTKITSHVNRVAATLPHAVLQFLLERDGVPLARVDRDLALVEDLLQ